MATTLKQMARRSDGGVFERMTKCMGAADYAMLGGGGGLLLGGLVRRSLPGLGVAGVGLALIAYSLCRDHDDEAERLRKQVIHAPKRYVDQNAGDIDELRQTPRDNVDEASMESFPGSDSPAYHRAEAMA